ncbi:MAG: DUF1232 domain-containing protein [Peptococcaceae bacterium]|nr:DUF1232 domain-containing protein [Peptococcaceae bacterium]
MDFNEAKTILVPVIKRVPAYTRLIIGLYRDRNLDKKRKALLTVGLAYAISPIDLIPGFIPVAGQLDDIMVALSSLKKVLKSLPGESRRKYKKRYHITTEIIDEDLAATKKITVFLLRDSGRYTWMSIRMIAKKSVRFIKKLRPVI